MDNKNNNALSFENEGAEIKAETSVDLANPDTAKAVFEYAKKRLLDVNRWQQLTGDLLANFQLTDKKGKPVQGSAVEGNLFKIDIPGPGSQDGQGFDWVCVEKITEATGENAESLSIIVRPCANPLSESKDIAHFYDSESTSTFTLDRHKSTVTASVYDKDVKPNLQTETGLDLIRNTIVGAGGILLFSRIQWKKLTEGLLNFDINQLSCVKL